VPAQNVEGPRARPPPKLILAALIALVALLIATALVAALFPIRPSISLDPSSRLGLLEGFVFWTVICLVLSNTSVGGPGGLRVDLGTLAVVAAATLGGPVPAILVAAIGTTELREIRGAIPWYGVLLNHAGLALAAGLASSLLAPLQVTLQPGMTDTDLAWCFIVSLLMAACFEALALAWSSAIVRLRSGRSIREVVRSSSAVVLTQVIFLPIGWFCAATYALIAPWAVLIFALAAVLWRQAQDQGSARREADHDPLTGLLNRRALARWLEQAAKHGRDPLTVIVLDLDGFKPINDQHGHEAGDAVLIEVGHRLHAVLRDGAAVARIGGDEFAVAVRVSEFGAHRIVDRLSAAIAEPITFGVLILQVTSSIGMSQAGPAASRPDALLRTADEAMYRAKRSRS
jgi:diguanylate cyclase (GGDEF)-like protein